MLKRYIIILILSAITFATIIGGLYYILNKEDNKNSSEPITYVLKKHNNSIAVFMNEQTEPYITLEVSFNNLPFEDKELLIKGIRSNNLTEIMKHAEDYDS